MPSANGFFMLVDGGANVDCRPEMLVQFAVMGSIYMNRVMKIDNPRVGLANVGTEDHKGTELYQTTYQLLKESNLNFVGNVEGRDIPQGICDVVVCDGFTGNLILKTYEGVAMVIMNEMKSLFTGSLKGKLSASLVLGDIKKLKKKLTTTHMAVRLFWVHQNLCSRRTAVQKPSPLKTQSDFQEIMCLLMRSVKFQRLLIRRTDLSAGT